MQIYENVCAHPNPENRSLITKMHSFSTRTSYKLYMELLRNPYTSGLGGKKWKIQNIFT